MNTLLSGAVGGLLGHVNYIAVMLTENGHVGFLESGKWDSNSSEQREEAEKNGRRNRKTVRYKCWRDSHKHMKRRLCHSTLAR